MKRTSLYIIARCFSEQISISRIEDEEEVEIFHLTAMKEVEETSTYIQTTMNLFNYQDIIETLAPTLAEHYTTFLQPYPDVIFSQEGIQYGGMHCTWYYIEHISTRLSQKFNRRAWPRDWKGPAAQCWCGDKLYSPSDECTKCHIDLRLWHTIKQYPLEEIAKCYWSTPNKDENNDTWEDLMEETDQTQPEVNLINDIPMENLFREPESSNQYLLSDYDPDEENDTFSNIEFDDPNIEITLMIQPWWIPPLETPSPEHLLEFDNYSEYYLCNIVW